MTGAWGGGVRRWFLLETAGDINEATIQYVHTLERAGALLGYALARVRRVRDIPVGAPVLALQCKTAARLLIARPRSPCWLWLQGIVPEEARLHYRSRLRAAYWTALERFAIPRARGIFLVSEAMRRHYPAKYRFALPPDLVMPCVNQRLDPLAFTLPGKYAEPRFVYAGSLHEWQCFDVTLDAYRLVKEQLPEARLTVLTTQEDAARRAVHAAALGDVTVRRVPLERLQEALSAHKYGFVLRREHVVNAVATPTKTSGYLAAGVIPVMTTAVHDYRDRFGALEHVIMSPGADPAAIAHRILQFEKRRVDPERVRLEYQRMFDEYLDHERYLPRVAEFLAATGLSSVGPIEEERIAG